MEQSAPIEPTPKLPEDETVEQTIAEDPLLKYFQDNWRSYAIIFGIVFAAYWAYTRFEQTREAALQDAGDLLYTVQQEYGEYSTLTTKIDGLNKQIATLNKQIAEEAEKGAAKKAESKEDSAKDDSGAEKPADGAAADLEKAEKDLAAAEKERAEISEKISFSLEALSDTRAPYSIYATLYRGLIKSDSAKSMAILSGLNWRTFAAEDRSGERFASELAALHVARLKLDDEESRAAGLKGLEDLAASGVFARVAAATAYGNVARSEEERSTAITLLSNLASDEPEQLEFVEDLLNRLKNQ